MNVAVIQVQSHPAPFQLCYVSLATLILKDPLLVFTCHRLLLHRFTLKIPIEQWHLPLDHLYCVELVTTQWHSHHIWHQNGDEPQSWKSLPVSKDGVCLREH